MRINLAAALWSGFGWCCVLLRWAVHAMLQTHLFGTQKSVRVIHWITSRLWPENHSIKQSCQSVILFLRKISFPDWGIIVQIYQPQRAGLSAVSQLSGVSSDFAGSCSLSFLCNPYSKHLDIRKYMFSIRKNVLPEVPSYLSIVF